MIEPKISINGWQVIWAILTNENKMKKIKDSKPTRFINDKIRNYVISTAREEKVTLTSQDISEAVVEIMIRIERETV